MYFIGVNFLLLASLDNLNKTILILRNCFFRYRGPELVIWKLKKILIVKTNSPGWIPGVYGNFTSLSLYSFQIWSLVSCRTSNKHRATRMKRQVYWSKETTERDNTGITRWNYSNEKVCHLKYHLCYHCHL